MDDYQIECLALAKREALLKEQEFELKKEAHKTQIRSWTKYIPTISGTIVGLAGIAFAYLGTRTTINVQTDNNQAKIAAELNNHLVDYVSQHQEDLLGPDGEKKDKCLAIISVCFKQVAASFLTRLAEADHNLKNGTSQAIAKAAQQARNAAATQLETLRKTGPPYGYRLSPESPEIYTNYNQKRIWVQDAANITGGLDCPVNSLGSFIEFDPSHMFTRDGVVAR